MKDFIFTDPSESTKQIVFRTDAIGTAGNNFTIHKIIGNNPQTALEAGGDIYSVDQWKRTALLAFREGSVTTKQALIDFATLWQLDLIYRDSNGANSAILVDWDSDSSADSW